MNEEPLRPQATSPFRGWALSQVTMSKVTNVILVVGGGGMVRIVSLHNESRLWCCHLGVVWVGWLVPTRKIC